MKRVLLSWLCYLLVIVATAQARTTAPKPDSVTTETSEMLNEINGIYSTFLQNIELLYKEQSENQKIKKKALEDALAKKNAQLEETKKEIDKLKSEIKETDRMITRLSQDKIRSLASIRDQKNKALEDIYRIASQKRIRAAREQTEKIKGQVLREKEDSLRLIPLRYQGFN